MIVTGYDVNGNVVIELDDEILTVPSDDPTNRHRQMIAEWEAEGNEIPPYVPPVTSGPYQLFKSVFISRMTTDEAVTLESILAGADAKLRLMFNSVEYFVSDDPLFTTLRGAVSDALGPDRAMELLNEP